jgi:hypothetical protein
MSARARSTRPTQRIDLGEDAPVEEFGSSRSVGPPRFDDIMGQFDPVLARSPTFTGARQVGKLVAGWSRKNAEKAQELYGYFFPNKATVSDKTNLTKLINAKTTWQPSTRRDKTGKVIAPPEGSNLIKFLPGFPVSALIDYYGEANFRRLFSDAGDFISGRRANEYIPIRVKAVPNVIAGMFLYHRIILSPQYHPDIASSLPREQGGYTAAVTAFLEPYWYGIDDVTYDKYDTPKFLAF